MLCPSCNVEMEKRDHFTLSGSSVIYVCPLCEHVTRMPVERF